MDPWIFSDPWSESNQARPQPAPLALSLIPSFFTKEDGSEPAILGDIHSEACGVCLLGHGQLEALVAMPAAFSSQECAGVVVSEGLLDTGRFPSEQIKFVAQHDIAGKILLKGILVNFGTKRISVKKAPRDYGLQSQDMRVVTFEVAKDHCSEWHLAVSNPMRFIWKNIDKAQTKIVTSWSRRFFAGKKVVSAHEASTFHCFARVLQSDLVSILSQSGCAGIFITPKGDGNVVDGSFRVVWLQTNDVAQAAVVAKTNPSVVGLVKGRSNLGLRVASASYTEVRQAIEPDWSNDMGIRYQVKVTRRFILAPVSQVTDKKALQAVLDAFAWNSLPMRQLGPNAWLIGAEQDPPSEMISINGEWALITPQSSKVSEKNSDGVVLSAPASIRKSLQRQIQTGVRQAVRAQSDVSAATPLHPPVTPANDAKIQELRDEINEKMQAMTAQFDKSISSVRSEMADFVSTATQSHDETQAQVQELRAEQQHRISGVEAQISRLTEAVCTKQDLSSLLTEALAKQSSEFRSLMAKRSPDPSPMNDHSKAAKTS